MPKRKNFRRGMAVALSGVLMLGGMSTSAVMAAEGEKAIVSLKTNGLENPLGVDETTPLFSWQMQSGKIGAAQTAYQITVKDMDGNVMWDSGKVESGESANIVYEGSELTAKTKYQWNVVVTDEEGKEYTSEDNYFETSLLSTEYEAWGGAQWVGAEKQNFDSTSAAYFDLDMTLKIPEGSTKASVVFGADDFRLQNKAMNVWNQNTDNNYFRYEVDVTDPEAPKLNIYVVGIPTMVPELDENGEQVMTTNAWSGEEMPSFVAQEEENAETEPDITLDLPAEVFANSGVHDDIAININTNSNINSISCVMNGVEVDSARQLNPLGNSHNQNSFPNLNSIGFAVPASETAYYTDVKVNYFGENVEGVHFDQTTGATYDIFDGLQGVTVAQEEDLITVEGGEEGTLVYADPSYGSAPMVRTQFSTGDKEIESARLYVTAQGSYQMYVNGETVSDGWFNPGNEEYSTTMPYQVYDVTNMLQNGDNAIGAQMGQGWWSGYLNYSTSGYNYYGAKQALMARMDVTYTDGTTDTIVTNTDDWKVSTEGPVESESNYQGERYNALTAKEYEGWSETGYDDSSWDNTITVEPRMNDFDFAVRFDEEATVVKELEAVEALGEAKEGTGSYIYDMGENVIGVPSITIPEGYVEEGETVTVRYAEILYPDLPEYEEQGLVGSMMVENLRAALCTDFYVAASGEQVFEPHFTFHGYRYIEISGLKKELPKENIKTEVLSSVEMTSEYNSSNELTNRLFKNVQNSQTSNFLSLPTDCPQRNERLGWTGDAQVFSMAASYNTDVYNFYRNWLKSLRACQRLDGSLPVYAPNCEPVAEKWEGGFSGVSWDAALTVIPYNMYMQTGNTEIITDNIEAIDAYLDYLANNPLNEEYTNLTSMTGILADWLSVDSTDAGYINNAVYVYLIGLTRDMAEVIGNTELQEKYAAKYDLAKAEWNKYYVNSETGKPNPVTSTDMSGKESVVEFDTEAAYATPLRYGVFNEENEPKAVENYVAAVEAAGYTITSGFSGTPNLVPVLTKYGYVEEAYKLFEQTDYASWLYPVVQGATSVWERWNSYTVEGGFNGNNSMNSFNHFSLGAISEWMMASQLGITREDGSAGYKHFILQPTPGGTFTFANGSFESNYGTIYSGWTSEEGSLKTYEATVPANTTATLYLPIGEGVTAESIELPEGAALTGTVEHNGVNCAQIELVSGTYEFTLN